MFVYDGIDIESDEVDNEVHHVKNTKTCIIHTNLRFHYSFNKMLIYMQLCAYFHSHLRKQL